MDLRPARAPPLDIRLVATDLDRTITDEDLVPVPAALAELDRLRAGGVKVVLCTGRAQAELPPEPFVSHFDAVVLEGGGVVGLPGKEKPVVAPPGWMLRVEAWLQSRAIPYLSGDAYVSVLADNLGLLADLPEAVPCTVSLNRDRVDVTPPGVDKGSALRRLMHELGWAGPVLAFGDGDNDAGLFAVAQHKVAVGNAVAALQALADEVAPGFGGRAVAGFLRTRMPGPSAPPPSQDYPGRAPGRLAAPNR